MSDTTARLIRLASVLCQDGDTPSLAALKVASHFPREVAGAHLATAIAELERRYPLDPVEGLQAR